MERITDQAAEARRGGTLFLTAGVCVGLYALAMGFLVVAIYGEDHSVNWALLVFCLAGLAIAVVVAVAARWSAWVALVYSLLTTAGDAPHQLKELAHPTGHAPASAVILLLSLAAILTSGLAAVRSLR